MWHFSNSQNQSLQNVAWKEPHIAGFRPSSKWGEMPERGSVVVVMMVIVWWWRQWPQQWKQLILTEYYGPGIVQNVSHVLTCIILMARVSMLPSSGVGVGVVQFTLCPVWMVPLRFRGHGNPDFKKLMRLGDTHWFCLPSTHPPFVWEHHAFPWVDRPIFVSSCCLNKWPQIRWLNTTHIPLQFWKVLSPKMEQPGEFLPEALERIYFLPSSSFQSLPVVTSSIFRISSLVPSNLSLCPSAPIVSRPVSFS